MVEAAPESIPTNLRDAFHFAVLNAPLDWSGEDPDAEIISFDRKLFTPSVICGLVTKFADPMPRYIYDVLRELGYPERGPFARGRRPIPHGPDRAPQGAVFWQQLRHEMRPHYCDGVWLVGECELPGATRRHLIFSCTVVSRGRRSISVYQMQRPALVEGASPTRA